MSRQAWAGRRVFVTGHTGFKGSWLSLWLKRLGATVDGYALAPAAAPSLFEEAAVKAGLRSHVLADIRDAGSLRESLVAASPEVVFHLAAQPLVRESYASPVDTFAVNVMGTAHLLEAVRHARSVRCVVVVTTDKCYDNREWVWPYRESDSLGGRDPYSSSKACAELVTGAYRDSFLSQGNVAVATARAGNVIGGGDRANDRLLPDFFRALAAGTTLSVRHPDAIRPWQHVLEPLAGYILLAERLLERPETASGAWNFGPADDDAKPVRWILERLARSHPGAAWTQASGPQPHEAATLRLDSSRARAGLGWRPRWTLERALEATSNWFAAQARGDDMAAVCHDQIAAYEAAR